MEYYILEKEAKYIMESLIKVNHEIAHNYTTNVEQARKYTELEPTQKQADFFECNVIKITINKEIIEG